MLLIGPGLVITRDKKNPEIHNGAVVTDGTKIYKLGEFETLKKEFPNAEHVDAHGGIIHPGFINTHHHIYSSFSRGLSINGYNPENFLEILKGLWWKLDETLLLEDVRREAQATLLSCIQNGVTTIVDHHASYGETLGSLRIIADEAKRFGVRSCLCYEISDRNGEKEFEKALQENLDFARYAENDTEHLKGLIGLHASFTLSDESLQKIKEANIEGFGYHVHVAESKLDQEDSMKKYGIPVVKRLDNFGMINDKSLAIHCVHVTDEEKEILKTRNAMMAHNPESNMGNAVGVPDVLDLVNRGLLIGLGTDGFTSDIIESLKFANLLMKHKEEDATIGFVEACKMAFENNKLIADKLFSVETGVLKEGAAADVIVIDYDAITPVDSSNIDGHIVFGMNGNNVVTTVSDGVVRMKDRQLQFIDKNKLVAEIREQARDFFKRINEPR